MIYELFSYICSVQNIESMTQQGITLLTDSFILQMHEVFEEEESIIASMVRDKFGVNPKDLDAVRELVKNKRLIIVRDNDFKILGISANCRWLYTPNGQTIGKDGKRWRIEDIKS